ncbi:MAG: nitronate monooxygenase [Clostridia bacterium]|nr:nitronate monooxygenase [Clostridia bacterium]
MKGIKIGEKKSKYPIIQGGMGVGISMHRLAGNVSKEGGIGIISTADIGYQEEDFNTNPLKANLRAIGKEIKKAREIAGKENILGVNIMVALNNYKEIVKECVKNKIDLIISGAGIPKELPEYVQGSKTKIAPIVSSLRCCKLIVKHWIKRYNYVPDMIVIEGPEAGGHLGFKKEELQEGEKPKLEDITIEVVNYVNEVEKEYSKEISVIVAGGIWDNKDIKKYLNLGATGVQMATRFVATYECDASDNFKKAYINAKKEDIKIINSPVGMPGRAIYNNFIKQTENVKCKIDKCYNCIKSCDAVNTPYCITKALVNAVKGNIENSLIFCGSNVDKVKEIVSVHNLMKELVME